MLTKAELRFNCCESVVMIVNEKHPLPGFDESIMRIASNFGGGVAGWGNICGALSGGAMAMGLALGTDGTESKQTFEDKRDHERKLTQELLRSFRDRWGYVGCCDLLGCMDCTPEARAKRGDELKAMGESHCDEYVEWVASKTLEILEKGA